MDDLRKTAEAAGRTLGDASVAANDEVQKRGPAVVAFIKKWGWVFALVVLALVYAGTRSWR